MFNKHKLTLAMVFISLVSFLGLTSVTAATASGFGKLGNITALVNDIFVALLPFFLLLAVIGIIAIAIPGVRKFFGGLLS